ncbi:MAG: GNAT family N-acetyltransferase [Planctomycetes bacterium]|nr:GNAT family N-acetyltransferase [Planctomycetota bacterium]
MLDLAGSLHLRPFALADVAVVEPWLAGPGLSVPSGQLRHDWPRHLVGNQRIIALIAERHGLNLGFVRLDVGPDRIAEITLVVAPQHRRAGFGSAMFFAALLHARRTGLRGFVAMVDISNAPALSFFADQGFVQDGIVGDRIRMQRFVHASDHAAPLDLDG